MNPPAPVSGEIGVDEFCFADRLAGDERHACDRAGQAFDRVRPILFLDGAGDIGAGRPGLPLHVLRRQRMAQLDVALGDQNVDGFDFCRLLRRRRRLRGTAGQQRGNRAR